MRPFATVSERLRSADMLQVLALFLAAQLFVLAIRWPGAGGSNEAWFALAPTRLTLLALAALGFGAADGQRGHAARRATVGALLLFGALSEPLDVAAYAGSYPAVPLWWAVGLPYLDTVGYYGLGLALGRVARWARIAALLPLLVPGLLVVSIWLDVWLGVNLLNPLTAAVRVSLAHAAVMLGLSLATAAALLWGGRRGRLAEADRSAG